MSYQNFAYYYDSLMDEKFYVDYYDFIQKHAKFDSILELGCGTAPIAIQLAKDNKEIYATDLSKDMLEVARMKAQEANVDLLLGRIDMADFKVDRPVDLVLCLCDSINYLVNTKQVEQTFDNVYEALKRNGTFIFDVNSMHKMEVVLKDYHEKNEDDEFSFEWKVEKMGLGKVKHYVDIIDKIEKDEVHEVHIQQTYTVEKYEKLLKKAGFKQIDKYSDFDQFHENCQRVIFVARKESKL